MLYLAVLFSSSNVSNVRDLRTVTNIRNLLYRGECQKDLTLKRFHVINNNNMLVYLNMIDTYLSSP